MGGNPPTTTVFLLVLSLGASMLLQACVTPRARSLEDPRRNSAIPALSVAGVLGPVDGTGHAELDRLRDLPDEAPVRLRRAYIWLSSGGHGRALRELNRVIFGQPAPTKAVESFARYLRAIAYEKQGDRERGGHDRETAAELARSQGLTQLAELAMPVPLQPALDPRRPLPAASRLSRAAWGAEAPMPARMTPMTRVQRLTVHHSAMLARDGSSVHAGAVVRSIQRTHMRSNGWGDIGYHYLIDRDGRIWDGRPVEWQGAHAGNPASNRGNIGICLLGNFVNSSSGQSPSSDQLRSLESLVAQLCDRFQVPPGQILTHRELKATTCPGALLQAAVERLRTSLLAAQPGPGRSRGRPAED